MRQVKLVLAVPIATIALLLPATASASDAFVPPRPLGELAGPGVNTVPCTAGANFNAFMQETHASGSAGAAASPYPVTYTVPTSGVITDWSGQAAAGAGSGILQLLVLDGQPSVAAASPPVDVSAVASGQVVRTPVRIPVSAGQLIALGGSGAHAACAFDTSSISDTTRAATEQANPFARPQALSFGPPVAMRRVNVRATLEVDEDYDGFGDITQDSCPDDPALTSGPCTNDLAVGLVAGTTEMETGDQTTLVLSVTNVKGAFGGGIARSVTYELPAGLELVAADERCRGDRRLVCEIPALSPTATTRYLVTVRATAVGKYVNTFEFSAPGDPDQSNNRASVVISVKARPAPKRCVVPRLGGRTVAGAKIALERAGCRLGRVTRPQRRGGRLVVVGQSVRAGRTRPGGTKVSVRLARRR